MVSKNEYMSVEEMLHDDDDDEAAELKEKSPWRGPRKKELR